MRREDIWKRGKSAESSASPQGTAVDTGSHFVSRWFFETAECIELRFEANKVGLKITSWFKYKLLALVWANAMYQICKKVAVGTRIRLEHEFRNGFLRFLSERKFPTNSGFESITTELLEAFVKWLKKHEQGMEVGAEAGKSKKTSMRVVKSRVVGKKKKKVERKAISVEDQKKYFSIAKRIFEFIQNDPDYACLLPVDFEIPLTHWTPPPPTDGRLILTDEQFAALLRAAAHEVQAKIAEISRVWSEKDRRAAEIKQCKKPPKLDYSNFIDFLIALEKIFGKKLFSSGELQKRDNKLFAFLQLHGGFSKVCEYRYPSDRALVPFVIMLSVYTSYNPETARGLDFNEIVYSDIFEKARVNLFGTKGRADGPQPRSFSLDDPRGVGKMLEFVESWTAPIRLLAPKPHRSKVFLFVIHCGRQALTVANWTDPRKKNAPAHGWYRSLKAFENTHNLPHFELAQLRGTSLDLVREITSNDLALVQLAGGQKSVDLLEKTYSASANRRRNDERLVKVMAARGRWVSTCGRVADHRQEQYGADLGAVTAGFRCLDAYDSPVPGEHSGRLCQAYGWCADCELGHVDLLDPHSLARLVQLTDQLHSAQQTISPQRWVRVWAPKLARLENYWLPAFDENVWEKAKLLTLGPIPSIE